MIMALLSLDAGRAELTNSHPVSGRNGRHLKDDPTSADLRPMAKKKSKTKEPKAPASRRYRDATTGRFVTKKYAKKHRKTTVKESAPFS
jgi:hypothetical protein